METASVSVDKLLYFFYYLSKDGKLEANAHLPCVGFEFIVECFVILIIKQSLRYFQT